MPFLRGSRPQPGPGADPGGLSDGALMERYRELSLSIEPDEDGAHAAVRAGVVDDLAAEVLRRRPSAGELWYDRGMLAKWRRDWAASRDFNTAALDLVPPHRRNGEPAAWNLGIAATALHDWPTARRAWAEFGITLPRHPGDGDEAPVEADFGPAPVRLNAEPRFVGETPLQIDGQEWQTEVVWGRRLCPSRILVLNVPSPESGHRFGDIVLHDGDTVGSRRLGEHELGVFNEIALWRRSTFSTLTATVEAPDQASVDALVDLLAAAGGSAEDWTANLQVLCRACSEGSPGATGHDHAPEEAGWVASRSLGIAAHPADAEPMLRRWAAAGPGRAFVDLALALD